MTEVRVAVGNWINRFPDLRVCGHAIGEKAAFEQIDKLRPGLVLTEILRLKDLAFVRQLHRRYPRLPVLVFSHQEEELYASQALAAGARGYLMKGVDGDTLVAAIRDVLKGKVVLSRAMLVRSHRNGSCSRRVAGVLPRAISRRLRGDQRSVDIQLAS